MALSSKLNSGLKGFQQKFENAKLLYTLTSEATIEVACDISRFIINDEIDTNGVGSFVEVNVPLFEGNFFYSK